MEKIAKTSLSVSHDVMLLTRDFELITGVKRSMRYLKWDARNPRWHDPAFPRPIKISPRCNRFSLNATNAWVQQQLDKQAKT